jgi:hypothetical protein
VSISGLLLIMVTTLVLVGGGFVLFGRARAAVRGSGADGLASRADAQRYLAENWALVEKTARESGMTEDEIARVRSNVLGVLDSS